MKALIIGGGIGGFAAALSLQAVGIKCEVFEQSTHVGELGVGINTLPHAIKELAELGEANYYSLGMKERELQERKQGVMHAAELRMRRELVNTAIRELTAELTEKGGDALLDQDVTRFVAQLEQRS